MDEAQIVSLVIIVLFIGLILVIGKYASTKIKSDDDYIVANRSASYFLIVGTLFATFWGGGTIIGATGAAFHEGVFGVIEDPFAAGLSLLILGIFFVKILRNLRLKSVGELYSLRFGKNLGYFASLLMIPTYIIWTAVQLLAISKILNIMFDLNELVTYLLATIVVITFTYMGGMLAVIWTDTVQMIIIFIGLITIVIAGFQAVGSVEEVFASAQKDFWNIAPRDFSFDGLVLYIAMWAGMALGNLPSPDLAQRAFIAKDAKTAQKGMVTAGILYWTIGFIPIIIALIGITLVKQNVLDSTMIAKDSELLIPMMAQTLLSPIFLGIFLASLIAAIISSASTSLFATSILVANDIIKNYFLKKHSKTKSLRIAKLSVIIIGICAAIIGLLSKNIYDLTIFAFSLQFGVLFFPFVLALKANWVTKYGMYAGMLTGLTVNILGSLSSQSIIPNNYTFYTLVPAILNLFMVVVVSLYTKNNDSSLTVEELIKIQGGEIK